MPTHERIGKTPIEKTRVVSKRLALRLILCFIDEQKGKHDASHWHSPADFR